MEHLRGDIEESDWKRLRKLAPVIMERVFEQINKESADILKNEKKLSQKDLYWEVFNHMEENLKIVETCFDDHRRSTSIMKISNIRYYRFFTEEEFLGFSQETRERVESILSV